MNNTKIEWTDRTWNPTRGCSRVSPGCENCYAERMAARFCGPGMAYEGLVVMKVKERILRRDYANGTSELRKVEEHNPRWTGKVELSNSVLHDPLGWTKPSRVFVNSMSDVFHESLSIDDIARIWAVMVLAPQHTFQVLTKRAQRMHDVLNGQTFYERVLAAAGEIRRHRPKLTGIGISNPSLGLAKWIWLGVSVENQEYADERIPLLIGTPAAVRFLSIEPLLGPVDLQTPDNRVRQSEGSLAARMFLRGNSGDRRTDWVIAGAESGPGARPMDENWVRQIRDQCAAMKVAFFYKQNIVKGKKASLPMLDGRQHQEFPSC